MYADIFAGAGGVASTAISTGDGIRNGDGDGTAPAESVQPPVLISGAGHDALAMAEACPIGMLFVRCRDGVSHSPLEHSEPEDVAFAARVLWRYLTIYQSTGKRARDGEL